MKPLYFLLFGLVQSLFISTSLSDKVELHVTKDILKTENPLIYQNLNMSLIEHETFFPGQFQFQDSILENFNNERDLAGLGILVTVFRRKKSVSPKDVKQLKR